MKIVSLENTNTLNVKLDRPTTVAELFRSAAVAKFAAGAAIDSIAAVDNADASLLSRNGDTRGLENYQLTEDSVIELNCFAENKEEIHTEPENGKVTVSMGGLGNTYNVNIIDGVTTVAQALTDKLAAAFDRSRDELYNMKISVNDGEASTASVLHIGDRIVLQNRKAGDHGAGDFIKVTDIEGVTKEREVADDDLSLKAFLFDIEDHFDYCCGHDLIDNLSEVDGNDVAGMGGAILDAILGAPAINYEEIAIDLDFADKDEMLPEDEGYDAEGVSEAQNFDAEGVAPEAPQCGKVKLNLGNTNEIEMLIKEGETQLGELLFSDKVLGKWAMTRGQMETMNLFINDVQVYKTDLTLHIGDVIRVAAPKCGDHGNK